MDWNKQDLDYAKECDFNQLQVVFSSSLDKLILPLLREGKSNEEVLRHAKQNGFLEQDVLLRIKNIIESNILSF